ncbi:MULTISPECIES: glycoside hydrolase family 3 N-terminal domain-containing protein [unclassified Pseudoxanthomonas]|uniref:glycoside hydrolase family 3 N-terminal domain-containing protein n=1 Tax=unclassified Pseudoxanthomonas TaxID=2645906 RepID=UPI001607DC47|nr:MULTISPECIES: glycoside hydrolase family 3 N-terminal domain-containing protein [unclassified Pseudoxanthomonas]MBB3277017.1 beta-glucosidase [Pseudoxanthomonas sp. OG2]MBV7475691.1 glycoside hydrolase family 3 C-terminal domain-containing protein [Pseudoxanthomonas sp. PXM05]
MNSRTRAGQSAGARPRARRHGWLAAAIATALIAPAVGARTPQAPAGEAAFVEALLAKMTVEEKLGQLNQPPGLGNDTGPQAMAGGEDQIRNGEIGTFLGTQGAELTCRLQRIAVEESRLGIPLMFGYDVIHGYRTIFPVPLGESASFDPVEVENAARVAAWEAAGYGIHWTYAPMVDVARDPRWGRIVEGAGEDPYLGSVLAAARVRGFQGKQLGNGDTLLATAKHFVAYGAAEGGRDYNIADISERTLREVYLPPFKAAVDAGAESVMASFNEVGGVPMHANGDLINDVLRKEWGWDGLLVSDYTGVEELIKHGVAGNRTDAGVLGLRAGVDIDMVSRIYVKDLPAAVKAGKLPIATVDESVRRVLRAKYRMGLFEDPYRYCDVEREKARTLTADSRKAAREMARKSMVLLDNTGGVLPLDKQKVKTLAVIGPLADLRRAMLGNWAGAGRDEDAITPLAGIRAAVGSGTQVVYVEGTTLEGGETTGIAEAVKAAQQADAVLLFLGEHPDMSAEARNRTSLDLPGAQQALADAVAKVGKPTAAVLLNGRPLSIGPLRERVPAILEAWFPGVEGGNAIADVVFGDFNPAGKLPVTFPRTVGQVPIYYAHKNTGRPPSETERYTSKYIDVPWTPLYAFGHGLSYTTFQYGGLAVKHPRIAADGSQEVSVTVTNTGKRAGAEVVQLYVRDDVASVTRPVKLLRGFERVELAPGQSKTLTFKLGFEDLAMYDAAMKRVVEPGSFTVFAGGNSVDTLEAKFEVTAK